MSTNLKDLVRLDQSCIKPAVEVLGRAFWNHPPLHYYFPDELKRKRMAPYLMAFPVFTGIRYGEVYATSPNLEGVAIWIPSDSYPMTFWRVIRSVPLSVVFGFGRYGGSRMRRLGEHVDSVHQRLAPFKHWFLQAIGVAPQFQGEGYAGKLLRPMLARMDEGGIPCYLETLEEQNVPLYEHFGFEVIEKSNVPETSLTNWAMLRETSKK